MAGYQRKTALAPSDVLQRAERLLPKLAGLTRSKGSGHGATYTGAEGTVTLSAHRHGPYTDVVATTDRLRTSRVDYEVQKFLNRLPYEPGDAGGPGSGEPDYDLRPDADASPTDASPTDAPPVDASPAGAPAADPS